MLPSRLQLIAWVLLALCAGLIAWLDGASHMVWILLVTWLGILAVSAWLCWRQPPPVTLSREVGDLQQCAQAFDVTLLITNITAKPLQFDVFDHFPSGFHTDMLPLQAHIAPNTSVRITYQLITHQRGRFVFAATQLRYRAGLALWRRNLLINNPQTIRVYPRFNHSEQQRFVSINTVQMGNVRPLHSRNGNGDFSHLRDYQTGDTLNQIDHKASMRMGKWISREFEFEHQQPVVLMLDSSRRMQVAHDGKSLFDELLACATQLAHTALQAGDEVGLQVFSAQTRRFLPSSRRSGQYRRIVEGLYDLYADNEVSEYQSAIKEVYRKQRKRSLIILMTVLEPSDEKTLRPLLQLLQSHHHVMLVNLRPPYLDNTTPIQGTQMALKSAARDVYANLFAEMEARLRNDRLIFVSANVETLRVALINHYLAYKQRVTH